MHDPIRRLAEWLRLLFAPGAGKRRAGVRSAAQCPSPAHSTVLPHLMRPSLPLHRSPYGLPLPLDGAECRVVRPYLIADFWIDLDRYVVGTEGAA